MPYSNFNIALAHTGLLVMLSEIQGSRQNNQVPTFYDKIDWESGWPVNTLFQLQHSLGPPLSSWSGFLRCKGLVKISGAVFYVNVAWETGGQSILSPQLGSWSCFLRFKGLVKIIGRRLLISRLFGNQGGQSMPYCNFDIALGPHWALRHAVWDSKVSSKNQVPSVYVNVNWETRCPIDTLLQL